ncbi:PfkB family carbohydrate kinase [Gordonia mangrovi]|uniref:PfkB family carbohydrate kinase n=1 Tax=Gordonia mangrovi TaxID=2665643 RepID=UPI0021ABAA69|nr:PfkB family carbohydrate kinase [Gordonia mangrovi]UVF78776.1 PfkB family carbohydrate kinase [Gordonia mangrovi]
MGVTAPSPVRPTSVARSSSRLRGEIASQRLIERGVACVAPTDGADGASVVTADRVGHATACVVDVVDTSGCGDAFSAGSLAARGTGGSAWVRRGRLCRSRNRRLRTRLRSSGDDVGDPCRTADRPPASAI